MLFSGVAFFSSCRQSEKEEVESNKFPLSIVARIGTISTPKESRYVTGSAVGTAHFDQSDAIGVFMDKTALLEWNYGIEWSPAQSVYWPDMDKEHDFNAFYPYNQSASWDRVSMPSLKDQKGTLESIAKCDFMVAVTKQSYSSNKGEVDFVGTDHCFKHKSCVVSLNLEKSEALNGATLTKISIGAKGLLSESVYSFEDNVVKFSETISDDVLDINLGTKLNEDETFVYFILNPKEDNVPVTLTLSYAIGGRNYTAKTDHLTTKEFRSGHWYDCKIQVRDSKLILVGGEVSSWDTSEPLDDIIIDGKEDAHV